MNNKTCEHCGQEVKEGKFLWLIERIGKDGFIALEEVAYDTKNKALIDFEKLSELYPEERYRIIKYTPDEE